MYKQQWRIVLITLQLTAFIMGQIVLPTLQTIDFQINYLLAIDVSLGIALVLQLSLLYYVENRCRFFWKAQHRFLIGYTLLAGLYYFAYYWTQLDSQIQDVENVVEYEMQEFLRYLNLSMVYCLACTQEYFNLPSYVVYEVSAVVWVLQRCYLMLNVIQYIDTQKAQELSELKDVQLAMLVLVVGLALFVMQELRESYGLYKRQKRVGNEHQKESMGGESVTGKTQNKEMEVELIN